MAFAPARGAGDLEQNTAMRAELVAGRIIIPAFTASHGKLTAWSKRNVAPWITMSVPDGPSSVQEEAPWVPS